MNDYDNDQGNGGQGNGGRGGAASGGSAARPAQATGVTLYRPIIVSVLYLCGLFTGFTVLIGLILAYVWRNDEDLTEWEETHFTYLIRTFWIGFWLVVLMTVALIAAAVAFSINLPVSSHAGLHGSDGEAIVILMAFGGVSIGFLLFLWSIVRSILSLANAANRRPMPRPKTWLF